MSKNKKIQTQTEAVDLKFGTKIQTMTTFEIMGDTKERNKLIKDTRERFRKASKDPILKDESFVYAVKQFKKDYGDLTVTNFNKLSETEQIYFIARTKELYNYPSATRTGFKKEMKKRLTEQEEYTEKDIKQVGNRIEDLYDEYNKVRALISKACRDLYERLGGDIGYMYDDYYNRVVEAIHNFRSDTKTSMRNIEDKYEDLMDYLEDKLSYNKVIESKPKNPLDGPMVFDHEESETGDLIG